ncbi:MAG: hypothetical protein LBC75_01080 [Fibromonadaceae bacterium]|jgi:hypothetical protein|nr:hypothetical protein [Fibromonadaceae bacterium]
MTATLEHRYRYMTRINWSAIGNIAGCSRWKVNDIFAGRKTNKRLSALLATIELPRKIDWRKVAERMNPYLTKPINPRYLREIACGQRRNKKLREDLEKIGIIEMLEKQRSFSSSTTKQEAL